jgi:hypothetical protein
MYSTELVKAIQIAINARVPMWIWGQAGVGKSSIVRMVARGLSREHIDIRPTMMDPVDMGIPYIDNGVCLRAIPSWLPTHGDTLLAVEELPDAPLSVQCALYQLVLERRLGDYSLPDGAYICATGNRAQDGGNYTQPPAPLLNRFLHITLESGYDSWAGWAAKGDANMTVELIPAKPITPHIRPELRAFFAFRKNLLVQKPIKSEFAFCTPRSVEMLSRILDQEPSDDIASDLINGLIGMGVGIEFLGFLRTWRSLPLISAIVANPMAVDIPTDLSACYATAVYLAANWKPANGDALCQYVRRLAPEYGCLFLRDLDARNKEAMASRGVIAMLNLPQFNDLMF